MPKDMGYNTGGVHEGTSHKEGNPGAPANGVNVGMKGAGMGTAYASINNQLYHPLPGGHGSSGKASKSTPSGGGKY